MRWSYVERCLGIDRGLGNWRKVLLLLLGDRRGPGPPGGRQSGEATPPSKTQAVGTKHIPFSMLG